jgi:hypothetical protein
VATSVMMTAATDIHLIIANSLEGQLVGGH